MASLEGGLLGVVDGAIQKLIKWVGDPEPLDNSALNITVIQPLKIDITHQNIVFILQQIHMRKVCLKALRWSF